MKCKLYYQDFRLNCDCISNRKLLLDTSQATFIADFEYKDKCNQVIVDNIFRIMNLYPENYASRDTFAKAEHTSMSVGDYILFEDGDIWQCGLAGWEIIPIK
jgi:hypothetical protein